MPVRVAKKSAPPSISTTSSSFQVILPLNTSPSFPSKQPLLSTSQLCSSRNSAALGVSQEQSGVPGYRSWSISIVFHRDLEVTAQPGPRYSRGNTVPELSTRSGREQFREVAGPAVGNCSKGENDAEIHISAQITCRLIPFL